MQTSLPTNWLLRIWRYTLERFHPAIFIPYGILSFVSPLILLLMVWTNKHQNKPRLPDFWQPHSLLALCCGATTVILISLLLRVMDEIKDWEIDRKLFSTRPAARGVVSKKDLQIFLGTITFAILLVNAWLEHAIFISSLIVLAYCFLMYKWFFWPQMSRHLVVALVTHNPVVPLLGLYSLAFFYVRVPEIITLPETYLVALLSWLPLLGWEIGRKIRSPSEETEYTTYSKIWGYKAASAVLAIILSATIAAWLYLSFFAAQLPAVIVGVYLAWLLAVIINILVFIIRPRKRPAGFVREMDVTVLLQMLLILVGCTAILLRSL